MAKNILEIHKSLEQSPLKEAPRTAIPIPWLRIGQYMAMRKLEPKGEPQPKAKKKETYRYLRTSVAQG